MSFEAAMQRCFAKSLRCVSCVCFLSCVSSSRKKSFRKYTNGDAKLEVHSPICVPGLRLFRFSGPEEAASGGGDRSRSDADFPTPTSNVIVKRMADRAARRRARRARSVGSERISLS